MTTTTDAPEQTANGPATETPEASKPKPAPKVPHACLCSEFEVRGETDNEVFGTGCAETTMRNFAQGHDARIGSFLVDGHFDGYTLVRVSGGKETKYATPAEALAPISEALAAKATKATENRQARVDAKAQRDQEREAKKAEREQAKAQAAAAKEAAKVESANKGAEVVAGSAEGDPIERPSGTTRIKVGRFEYDAVIDEESGTATYRDGKGDEQSRERDGYRVLA